MRQVTIDQALQLALNKQRAGRLQEAESICRQILLVQPEHGVALNVLGQILSQAGRKDEAISVYRKAVASNPEYVEANGNLGSALAEMGDIDQAIASFQRALALKPDFAGVSFNLGNAWMEKGEIDKAIACFADALCHESNNADIFNNLGNAWVAKRDFAKAEECFGKAIAAQPNNALANLSRSTLMLLQGDFERGLPLYEWRRRSAGIDLPNHLLKTEWDGSDLAGRRILIHPEQGFGDAIMCSRYIPLLAKLGGRVILMVRPELRRLMGCLDSIEQLITPTDPVPGYDVQCPIMSLPLRFKTTLRTIPVGIPYLKSDVELKRQWQARLPSDGRLKVGLATVGRRFPDPHRTAPASTLGPLFELDGIWFCSVQKSVDSTSLDYPITDYSGELLDFADTAALMDNLDLIITIDSASAHLSGALGKPTWVMLKNVPDWRWMLDRTDSPWYPTMRLFRQPKLGDWKSVISQVAGALTEQFRF